ncbi:MAG: hypothetical protein KDK91_07005 [Gammaproteobacteria bacterium]|nr:hypothetical protein [Gammaproteobacteria bacterium]
MNTPGSKLKPLAIGTFLLTLASSTLIVATPASAKVSGEKPDDSPGWVVIEEDWYYPLLDESSQALHDARAHFRKGEERAAANELRKAEAWLRYAAGHAMQRSKDALTAAAGDLRMLAQRLHDGKVVSAAELDKRVAQASEQLAAWHYYKARASMGAEEERHAAQELLAAARHLRLAASSARYEYGPDGLLALDTVEEHGRIIERGEVLSRDALDTDLRAIGGAVDKMATALAEAAD